MLKFRNYIMILKCIMIISIFSNTYSQYNNNFFAMISLFSFSTIMMVNDYIRNVKLKSHTKYVYISLSFSIFAALILQYFVVGESTTIYAYCFLFEIFQLEKSMLKFFLSTHFSLFFLVDTLSLQISNADNIHVNLSMKLLAYLGTAGIMYYQKTIEIEKEEIKQLNEKLKLANIKLQEYALEIEEATISSERTRVAQELHDSLGHSLMALAMHLEFAKKICTTKPQKVEEVLEQSEKIAKSSINDLRKAVTLLNSEVEIADFDTSIEKLIHNFYLVSNLKITCTKNSNINNLSSLIKTSIYKTIQECITNSLKHGNATEINIKITATNENIEFIITDNGIGCNNIIKSNGLNGIENRINLLSGTTYYFSHNGLGFGIKVFIPI